jgi:hypothetical protein
VRRGLIARHVGATVALAVCAVAQSVPQAGTAFAGPGPAAPPARSVAGVDVHPVGGDAFDDVTITVSVPGAGRTATVTIRDGSMRLASGLRLVEGAATFRTNALGPGPHRIAADLVDAAGVREVGAATTSCGTRTGAGNVVVAIPRGTLTITVPSTVRGGAAIADVVITDTRAGNLGFAASVTVGTVRRDGVWSGRGSRVGLVGVHTVQVPGNALRARDVTGIDIVPGDPGLGLPRVFATYPAGLSTGTARVLGRLEVHSAVGVPRPVTATRVVVTAM